MKLVCIACHVDAGIILCMHPANERWLGAYTECSLWMLVYHFPQNLISKSLITYEVNSLRPSDASVICISILGQIGSDSGLAPFQCQVITRANDDLLPIGPMKTIVFSEIWIKIHKISFKKMYLKMWFQPQCVILMPICQYYSIWLLICC